MFQNTHLRYNRKGSFLSKKYTDQIKVKELREEVLLRQLSTAYGSAAETGNDILERLLDPFLDSISGIVDRQIS